ncbi:hypothetical protein [Sulfurovum sp.]|jgi:hypothetical protein|uniref:hypothetical protein n=1 Tax=Sulfurovum sp. TaxID=1969726 RepID=UPI002A36F571|nr:hypothetical protein [Sulfurovum sp.]MDD2450308.1 hypothetical protein [Sulfurovum sp.]MDY0401893.1 hypothetical protein [Sulfurovum sp.]
MKKISMGALFLSVLVHLSAAPAEIKDINDRYEVRIVKSDDLISSNSYWEIRDKKDHTIVYNEKMLPGYQKGDEFAYQHYLDIDGKTFMISSWSGGAHCCYEGRFFEIGDNGSLVFKMAIDGGNCHIKFKNNVIHTCDDTFAYAFGAYAASPLPAIIYENYTFAYEKMKGQDVDPIEKTLQDALNDDMYISSDRVSKKTKRIESFSNNLYYHIVKYIYTGKIDMAVELFNRYNEQIKSKFQKENRLFSLEDNRYIFEKIMKHLKKSSYYGNIKKLNEGNKHYDWFNR